MNASDTNTKAYLEAAKGWETDEIMRSRNSERRAWWVAGIAIFLAICGVLAVVLLTPLKTVEPFVVRVDKNTGATDIVTRLDENTVTFNEAIDKYFLARYLSYCESYSQVTAFTDWQACSMMSSPAISKAFFETINPKNPKSPTAVYGAKGHVAINVESIAFLNNHGMAQVRFVRHEYTSPDSPPMDSEWLATVVYQYLNPPVDERSRLINPVGFQVAEFRIDPVVVTTAAVAPATATSQGGAN